MSAVRACARGRCARVGGARDASRQPRTSAIQSFSTHEKSQFFSSSVSFQPRFRIVS
jgi:hypothetical protein